MARQLVNLDKLAEAQEAADAAQEAAMLAADKVAEAIARVTPDAKPVPKLRGRRQPLATHIIEIGRKLIEAKELLNHGEWLPWLQEHCVLSERTANRYMAVARSGVEIRQVADLGRVAAASQALSGEPDQPVVVEAATVEPPPAASATQAGSPAASQGPVPFDKVPGEHSLITSMRRHGIEPTRQNAIRLAWGRDVPDEEWTPEHEEQLPPELQEGKPG